MVAYHAYNPVPVANPKKEGTHYDDCISCGRRDIPRVNKIGGKAQNGEDYLLNATYSCSPRDGGCGQSWARTTRQGMEHDAKHGIQSRWPTQSAAADRVVSMPSEAFRERFDLIDWSR